MANETINNFIKSAKKATKKAAATTIELTDIAALNVKLQGRSVKLSEKYEKLGKLSYDKFSREADNAEKIAEAVAEIDAINNDIESIKAEIKAKKDALGIKKEEKSSCDKKD